MGRLIDSLAGESEVCIVTRFEADDPVRNDEPTRKRLESVSVLLDFSVAESVPQTVEACMAMGKNLVVGTTGWDPSLKTVRDCVEKSAGGLVYGSNFSIGVQLFFKIARYAAGIMNRFHEYDVYLEEAHHKMKKDAPSGTALALKRILSEYYHPEKLSVSSIRAGYIPGTHSVSFDGPPDSLHLEHRARNREGFARGALTAARWIHGRRGYYDFRDVVGQILEEKTNGQTEK